MSRSLRSFLALAIPALLVACGNSSSGGAGGGATTTHSTTTTTSTSTTSAMGTGGSAVCEQNCITNNAAAYAKFQGYLLADCACAAGSPCNTACAAACPSGTPSMACNTCVTNEEMKGSSSACTTTAGTSCVSDTSCSAFVACELTCPM